MDNMVEVEGHGTISFVRAMCAALRLIALSTLAAAVTACGGGGGGGDGGGGGGNPTGTIAATVNDQFGTAVTGATVSATNGTTTRTATTAADGTGTVTLVPTGTASVTATAIGLTPSAPQSVTVNANATSNVTFTLQRVTEAAGGISAAVPAAPLSGDGSSFTFRLRVVVIDQNFNPVEGLTASAFTLAPCDPVTEPPPKPDCVRGNSGDITGSFDANYTVSGTSPTDFAAVAALPAVPYAAGLLFDSSRSMRVSDESDARISASKVFLDDIGSDLVMLAAFSDDDPNGGANSTSLLPAPPLTYYPCAAATPCTPPFTSAGNDLLASLDSLATLEAGGTPLYDSLATIIVSVDSAAPANVRQAAVLFSDGKDIYCDPPDGSGSFAVCNQRRGEVVEAARSSQVDIFTIGLSNEVDSLAMAELALRNGGAYMFAERPTQLISIFGVLGRLLSNSLPSYDMVWTVNAAAGTLAAGRAVIGRLTVNTGSATFPLPFVVQIQPPPP
jgi:Carboxypeptidase regulatory-like domain